MIREAFITIHHTKQHYAKYINSQSDINIPHSNVICWATKPPSSLHHLESLHKFTNYVPINHQWRMPKCSHIVFWNVTNSPINQPNMPRKFPSQSSQYGGIRWNNDNLLRDFDSVHMFGHCVLIALDCIWWFDSRCRPPVRRKCGFAFLMQGIKPFEGTMGEWMKHETMFFKWCLARGECNHHNDHKIQIQSCCPFYL